jgi:hypothetical protein
MADMMINTIWQSNTLKDIVHKIKTLTLFYETKARETHDPFCGTFLKNCADKKRTHLSAIEKVAHNHGIEMALSGLENFAPVDIFIDNGMETTLDGIFNFISIESLSILKNATFLSMKAGDLKPVFQKIFELEEEFLVFVQEEYLRQLAESAMRIDEFSDEKIFLASAL